MFYDRKNWRALAPHLQRKLGGTESIVARLFCYKTFAMEVGPDMELGHYTEHELRILAQMSKQFHKR